MRHLVTMIRKRRAYMLKLIFLSVLAFVFFSCKKNQKDTIHAFDLKEIAAVNTNHCEYSKNRLYFRPESEQHSFSLTGLDSHALSVAQYLVLEVYHEMDYSTIIYLDFFDKNKNEQEEIVQQGGQSTGTMEKKPQISCKIGVLPKLKTQVIFPLSYLDNHTVFLPRFYRQLKGMLLGNRIEPKDLDCINVRLGPYMEPDFTPGVWISSIYLANSMPERYEAPREPYVDEFGQWNLKDWKGKIHSQDQLISRMDSMKKELEQSSFPADWSQYGGWKELRFDSTGFFHVVNDSTRWWFVDPDGYAYLSLGMDAVRPGIPSVIDNREELFEWLPEKEDSVFKHAYIYDEQRKLSTYDYMVSNLIRVFGKGWKESWMSLCRQFLVDTRFNTIANWSDKEMISQSRLPYVLPMAGFPETKVKLFRDFPDVFDPVYQEEAIKYAKQLEAYKEDRYLIGYFLRNEPEWAFGDHSIAFEMLRDNQASFSRKELALWLKERYRNEIDKLNRSWKVSLKQFKDIESFVLKEIPSQMAGADLKEFSGILVDKYVGIVVDEVKKVDQNHLNMGMRYAWISSDLCYRAGKHFDVFSINGYAFPGPPETAEITEKTGKPVIIGEFHYGAVDRGLPSTGIQGVMSQEDRGKAYSYYVEQGFARPEIIGLHYFKLSDQSITGRFDGENYQIGFVDICFTPYRELVNDARKSHEDIYRIASGKKKPTGIIAKKAPQIFF